MSKPVVTFRAFNVQASVFIENDKSSVVIKKTYKVKDKDEYKETDTFFAEDLPRLTLVSNKAYEYLTLKEKA